MFRVGQSDEWNSFLLPILFERRSRIGPDRQDFHATSVELVVLFSQARQLRAAVRSHKTAQECEYYGLAAKIR